MSRFVVRRLFFSVITLIVFIPVVFFATHLLGDPVYMMVPSWAGQEVIDATRHRFGLDLPIWVQFFNFLKNALHGDFGVSLWARQPALQVFGERIMGTLTLAGATIVTSVFLGVLLGTAMAMVRKGSWLDRILTFFASFAISSIDFWIGMILVFVLAITLGLLPTSGHSGWQSLIMPVIALSVRAVGRIALVTCPAINEQLGSQYVVAIRARGLLRRHVLKHVLRNVAVVVLTFSGFEFAMMLNGSVFVETVFAWPGIGLLSVQAVSNADWPLLVTITTLVAAMIVVLNLLIDLLYGWLNPKIRLE